MYKCRNYCLIIFYIFKHDYYLDNNSFNPTEYDFELYVKQKLPTVLLDR